MHLIHFPLTNWWILANISSEATNLFNSPLPEAQKKAYLLIQSVGAAEDLLSDEYYSCLCETWAEIRENYVQIFLVTSSSLTTTAQVINLLLTFEIPGKPTEHQNEWR